MPTANGALPDYFHERPFNREFYEGVRAVYLQRLEPQKRLPLPAETGSCIDVAGGSLVGVEIVEGPQVVNFFAFNPADADERLWVHNTSSVEGAFLRRYSRLWGTMARFRPMLTIIEDSVVSLPTVGAVAGKHHFVIGGYGTPAAWTAAGGSADVQSPWERLAAALATRGLPARLLKDDVCLFQKTQVDPRSQVLTVLPSDAKPGDRVIFFVEFDVVLVLALSPFGDGTEVGTKEGPIPRRVDFVDFGHAATPLEWPYEGVPYPDLSLYLDADGVRSDTVEATRGRESEGYELPNESNEGT